MAKFKVQVLFGGDAVEIYRNGVSLKRAAEQGEMITREFNTEAERKSYINGVEDAVGWLDAEIVKTRITKN